MAQNETNPEVRHDAQNANEYSDDDLEESWRHYVEKYVNDDMEGTDLLRLDALEAEMGRRGWKILVSEDKQEVDRDGGDEGYNPPENLTEEQ